MAEAHLNHAKILLDDQEYELMGFIEAGLGEIERHKQNYDEAFKRLDIAQKHAKNSKNLILQSHIYESLINYHEELNDQSQVAYYKNLHLNALSTKNQSLKKISNKVIKELHVLNKKSTNHNSILISIFTLTLLFILFFTIRSFYKQQKERAYYIKFIEKQKKLKQRRILINASVAESEHTSNIINEETEEGNQPKSLMPKETEDALLKALIKLEDKEFYLKNDITLSKTASILKTNTKYASYIINKNREKNFRNYINDLRIEYIIDKLQNDPTYLDYKIAYLAEECGFSTHSRFTMAFTTFTGLSPSSFIHQIKKGEKE